MEPEALQLMRPALAHGVLSPVLSSPSNIGE
jgi:hypothetical protein